jgi:hypothetical protein
MKQSFLGNMIIFQLVKTSLPLMEPECSLTCSQKHTTGLRRGSEIGKPSNMFIYHMAD